MLDVDAPKIISKMQKERDVEGLTNMLKLDLKDGYVVGRQQAGRNRR